ncbi:hypothetical protein KQH61_03565 [bacterium]|nr:hypothetical protein [bacterium]MCB2178979.1 hypothetical protein [bacterium]
METTSPESQTVPRGRRLPALWEALRWTKASYWLMSGFVLLLFLIGYVWWPLVEEYMSYFNPHIPLWRQIDWLLIGIFLFMSLMIMAGANLKRDLPILLVGMVGGLAIEGWGTQTELWSYYTFERPPLWIIPAWPIASLSIDRLYRLLRLGSKNVVEKHFRRLYWVIFPLFVGLMFVFVWPTRGKSLTILATLLVLLLIYAIQDRRGAVLTFAAGAGLGYFLELWGTTRVCWTYYTLQTPPLFAVLAHGMAAVAFWWGYMLLNTLTKKVMSRSLKSTVQDR